MLAILDLGDSAIEFPILRAKKTPNIGGFSEFRSRSGANQHPLAAITQDLDFI